MKTWEKIALSTLAFVGFGLSASVVQADSWQDMYRLYNPNSGEHFYTANTNEKSHLQKAGWRYEGVGWVAPSTGKPVYRLYNPNVGDHHYTMSLGEQKSLLKVGWKDEGIGWFSDANEGIKVWRAYNPNARTGSHNYTINPTEQQLLIIAGWKDEGIAWYGVDTEHPGKKPLEHPGKGFDNHLDEDETDAGNGKLDIPIDYVKPGDNPTQPTEPGNKEDSNQPVDIPSLDLPDNEPDEPQPTVEAFDGRAVAEEVFRLVNEERRNVGVPELKWSERLYEASLIRAKELITLYSHTRPDGSDYFYAWKLAGISGESGIASTGENANITFIQPTNLDTAKRLFDKWKASPGHYENMIRSNFDYFACGVIFDKSNPNVVKDADKAIYGIQSFVEETSRGSFE